MLRSIVVTVAALTGLMMSAGTAGAEDVLETDEFGIPWSWYTEAGCQADAPMLMGDAAFNVNYPYWFCDQGVSGLWYFYSSDQQFR